MSELIKNIISKISEIKKDVWGDRLLKGSSGETVGKLTKGGFFHSERTQRILDKNGRMAGKITEGGFLDPKDTQLIRDKDDRVVGRIETNFWGKRIIKDESGKKIGEVTKNFWGETVIKKDSEYDWDSKKGSECEDKLECPYCGEEYDSFEPECPYCGEDDNDSDDEEDDY
jgi:hypothetical protein